MVDYLYEMGEIEPPSPATTRHMMEKGTSRDQIMLVRGLAEQACDLVKNKTGFQFTHRDVEVRVPRPRAHNVVDTWHRDSSDYSEDFWLVLWNTPPMTEIVEYPEPVSYEAGEFSWVAQRQLNELPIIPIRDNQLIIMRNSKFAHRRPRIDSLDAPNRWFMRIFPRNSHREFAVAMEAYRERQNRTIRERAPANAWEEYVRYGNQRPTFKFTGAHDY